MSLVRIVEVAMRLVAVVRSPIGYAGMGDAQRRARPLLAAALRDAGIGPDGPSLTVWWPLEAGRVDYAPGVFLAPPIVETREVTLLTLPAGQAAHLTLTGSYGELPAAWERLFAGCTGRVRAGLNWEIYTVQGADAATTDLYTLLR